MTSSVVKLENVVAWFESMLLNSAVRQVHNIVPQQDNSILSSEEIPKYSPSECSSLKSLSQYISEDR